MTEFERICYHIATIAHVNVDQCRKYTGEHYINHPAAVVEIVRSVPHTQAMICAAWLHDVVEDTDFTMEQLSRVLSYMCGTDFSNEVCTLVEMLTDVSKPEDGNRATRRSIDKAHTALSSPAAKTIKLADIIHNTKSINEHDPDFARVYLHEKLSLLEVLKEGDETLYVIALKQCEKH